MISAVVPAYNAERTIERTLSAIIAQSVPPSEIIVVNDGSTDRTRDVVATLNSPLVRIIDQVNSGVSAARNRGAREAAKSLVAFCDADDVWRPTFLETILRLYRSRPDAAIFATSYRLVPPDAAAYDARLRGISFATEGLLTNYFDVASQSDPPVCSSAVAIQRAALLGAGGFPEGVVSGEDLLTWAKLAAKHPVAYSRTVLVTCAIPRRADYSRGVDGEDRIESELLALSAVVARPIRPALRAYIARWHEMRTLISLGHGDIVSARGHLLKMFRCRALTLRWVVLAGICSMPGPLACHLFILARGATTPHGTRAQGKVRPPL